MMRGVGRITLVLAAAGVLGLSLGWLFSSTLVPALPAAAGLLLQVDAGGTTSHHLALQQGRARLPMAAILPCGVICGTDA